MDDDDSTIINIEDSPLRADEYGSLYGPLSPTVRALNDQFGQYFLFMYVDNEGQVQVFDTNDGEWHYINEYFADESPPLSVVQPLRN